MKRRLTKSDRDTRTVIRETERGSGRAHADAHATKARLLHRIRKSLVVLLAVYSLVPLILYLCPWTLGQGIYMHLFRVPFFVDLRHPEDVSLNHTVNFYLTPEEGIVVGVWHTVPDAQWQQAQGRDLEWFRRSLGDGAPIIVYLHGNVGTRALGHRVELVKILSAAGFHVLTMDYRGYGDSTGQPSEAGMTTDAFHLCQWVKAHSGRSAVYLWGHSLGSGVATNAAVKLQDTGAPVDAVVVEAPFTNILEATLSYPLLMFYRKLPGFRSFIRYTLTRNDLVFPSDDNVRKLRSPLLLLHAEDDQIVPFYMSQKLYQIALAQKQYVRMVSYNQSLGYAHNGIYKDPNLSSMVWRFLQAHRRSLRQTE